MAKTTRKKVFFWSGGAILGLIAGLAAYTRSKDLNLSHQASLSKVGQWVEGASSCPLASERGSASTKNGLSDEKRAAAIDGARRHSAAAMRGSRPAEVRVALGFELDKTSRQQVLAWAAKTKASCAVKQGGALVHCERVAAASLPATRTVDEVDELSFGFNTEGHLVNVTTMRYSREAAAVAAELDLITGDLAAKLGLPTKQVGEATPEHLSTDFGSAISQYRYSNYIADVSGVHLPGRGVVLREHYMSASEI